MRQVEAEMATMGVVSVVFKELEKKIGKRVAIKNSSINIDRDLLKYIFLCLCSLCSCFSDLLSCLILNEPKQLHLTNAVEYLK